MFQYNSFSELLAVYKENEQRFNRNIRHYYKTGDTVLVRFKAYTEYLKDKICEDSDEIFIIGQIVDNSLQGATNYMPVKFPGGEVDGHSCEGYLPEMNGLYIKYIDMIPYEDVPVNSCMQMPKLAISFENFNNGG